MKNTMKKFLCMILVAILCVTCVPVSRVSATDSSISIGDTITLGTYNGEPITWICVDIDDNGPLMLSEKVLCTKEYDAAGKNTTYHNDGWGYIRERYGSNCWYDSNIRQWLNTIGTVNYTHCPPSYSTEAGFMTNFSSSELNCVKTVTRLVNVIAYESKRSGYCEGGSKDTVVNDIYKSSFPATNYYYDYITDGFFLLSAVQFNNIYKSNPNYLKASSKYFTCVTSGNNANCFEWVASVQANGTSLEVSTNAYMKLGVRPAFYLDVDAWETEYTIAGRTFKKNIDYYTTYTDSSDYNPELANMTAALSKAVYSYNDIESAYSSLGFSFGVEDYNGEFNPYKSGHAIGLKKSSYNDDYICLVAVRGSVGNLISSDWIGNYSIATTDDEKHIGFAYPANYIYQNIKELLNKNNITGNVKYVITGHSRGAAVANLLSVQLMENGISSSNVYNYNFACPDVACKSSFSYYGNIFNMCNREDPVPFIPGNLASVFTTPGTAWGKFGKTYWFTKDADGTISPFDDHDMNLYLSFFDKQLSIGSWDYTLGDLKDDVYHSINGWIAKILCPVDVILTDTEGNKIASVINGEINYYNSNFGDVIILTDGDKKVIYVAGDRNFDINLIGTDDGTMLYSIEKINMASGEVFESKTFNDVKLEKGKTMYSPVSNAETTEAIELFVVETENDEPINTYEINEDGSETEINHLYVTEVIIPNCIEKGYTTYTCLNCGNSYNDSHVDALGHSDHNHDGICDSCAEDFTKDCSCLCHSNAFLQFIHKVLCFIFRLFGMTKYRYCSCGKAHW